VRQRAGAREAMQRKLERHLPVGPRGRQGHSDRGECASAPRSKASTGTLSLTHLGPWQGVGSSATPSRHLVTRSRLVRVERVRGSEERPSCKGRGRGGHPSAHRFRVCRSQSAELAPGLGNRPERIAATESQRTKSPRPSAPRSIPSLVEN
jgi:hypothetical protein